ncbi:MAG: alpha/beta hydrolase [Ferruginibacter sp.]
MAKKEKNIIIGNRELPILLDIFYEDWGFKLPVVIYAHGFNGFKDWGNFDLIADKFARERFTFIKFNFSHNGTTADDPESFGNLEAFGQNNYTKQLADLKMVVDWVTDPQNPYSHVIDANKINLIGHSMGGGISILFANEDARIKKIIGWASIGECKTPWGNWPAAKINEWKRTGVEYYLNGRTKQQMPLYYQLYEDFQQNQERLNIQKAITNLKIPILLCHGLLDEAVPIDIAYQLKEWQPKAQLFKVESDHVFGRTHPWLQENLPDEMEEVVNISIIFLKRDRFEFVDVRF